jgi:hypothetical protein
VATYTVKAIQAIKKITPHLYDLGQSKGFSESPSGSKSTVLTVAVLSIGNDLGEASNGSLSLILFSILRYGRGTCRVENRVEKTRLKWFIIW